MYTDEMIQRLRDVGHSEETIRDILLEDAELDQRTRKIFYQEWLGLLVKMWDAVDKEVDEKRLAVYAEQFKPVPFGLLEKAVGRAIRNNGKYLTVPSVGALWDAIRQELGNDTSRDVLESIQHWMQTQDAMFEMTLFRFTNETELELVAAETEA